MKSRGFTLIELMIGVVLVLIIPVLVILLSMWTDRTLDFWLTFIKHSSVDVPMWLSVIATIVFNGGMLAINIISEIVRLAI